MKLNRFVYSRDFPRAALLKAKCQRETGDYCDGSVCNTLISMNR